MVYDSRTSRKSEWVGIILRNIPQTSDMKGDISKTFNKYIEDSDHISLDNISGPYLLQHKMCSVITIPGGMQVAESICLKWNKSKANNEVLKCHIHPYSCYGNRKKRNHQATTTTITEDDNTQGHQFYCKNIYKR